MEFLPEYFIGKSEINAHKEIELDKYRSQGVYSASLLITGIAKKLMQTDVNMQISYLLFTLFPHLMYLFYYHMKREKDIIFSFSFFFSLKIRTSVTLFAFGHYVENYILAFVVFILSCFFFLADFFGRMMMMMMDKHVEN